MILTVVLVVVYLLTKNAVPYTAALQGATATFRKAYTSLTQGVTRVT
jgi:hypothetical protein